MRTDTGSLYRHERHPDRATRLDVKRRNDSLSSQSPSPALGEAARRLERQFIEVLAGLAPAGKG